MPAIGSVFIEAQCLENPEMTLDVFVSLYEFHISELKLFSN